ARWLSGWVNEAEESGLQFDVLVTRPDGSRVYVEVKTSKSADKALFEVSHREWLFAQAEGEAYHIYRVTGAGTSRPQVKRIVNPLPAVAIAASWYLSGALASCAAAGGSVVGSFAGATMRAIHRGPQSGVRCHVVAKTSHVVPHGRVSLVNDPFANVSAERGFLPLTDPLQRLRGQEFDAWERALHDIPKLAVAGGANGRLRRTLSQLPAIPSGGPGAGAGRWEAAGRGRGPGPGAGGCAGSALDGQQLWRAYHLLSFLAHAYMWCEASPTSATPGASAPPPPTHLPAVLAVPWVAVAEALDMPPVLVYATYNLLNWRRLDVGPTAGGGAGRPGGASSGGGGGSGWGTSCVCSQPPIASQPASQLSTLQSLLCAVCQNFMASLDEEWFRLVHVDIEARAARALALALPTQRAAAQGDEEEVERGLLVVAEVLQEMQAVLGRMGEKCDPLVYYRRVRLPMSGWRNNPGLPGGLVYSGTSPGPGLPDLQLQLYGETGAQSSILPAFDAVLGVRHEQGWLQDYLTDMRAHMPPRSPRLPHVPGVLQASGGGEAVRQLCNQRPALRDVYNEAVTQLQRFRSQHKSFAGTYIAKWAQQEEREAHVKGTGGTNFMPALGGYQGTTAKHRLQQAG
ncbi:hypothetical protein QJQ45_028427, partial [Haematococcus lacustris]